MKLKIFFSFFFICNLLFSTMNLNAQTFKPEALDFWIGKWNASWQGGHAVNTISKVLDEKVVLEEFVQDEGQAPLLIGKSWSVFNAANATWSQTWVDNQGSYLDFKAEMVNDNFSFSRIVEINGKMIQQRMIFLDIKKNSFIWDWESSSDGGTTWKKMWRIYYTRII